MSQEVDSEFPSDIVGNTIKQFQKKPCSQLTLKRLSFCLLGSSCLVHAFPVSLFTSGLFTFVPKGTVHWTYFCYCFIVLFGVNISKEIP